MRFSYRTTSTYYVSVCTSGLLNMYSGKKVLLYLPTVVKRLELF